MNIQEQMAKFSIADCVAMSRVKADDMDAIGQSGAANLLQTDANYLEKLNARNEKLEAVYEAAKHDIEDARKHIADCELHPLFKANQRIAELEDMLDTANHDTGRVQ